MVWLTLLIASLTIADLHAQSVKFEFLAKFSEKFPIRNNSRIHITTSAELEPFIRSSDEKIIRHENGIKFVSDEPILIPVKGNESNFKLLERILKTLTKSNLLIEEEFRGPFFSEQDSHSMNAIVAFVERTMIKHGYSVTLKEKIDNSAVSTKDYHVEWIYYFFKPQVNQ